MKGEDNTKTAAIGKGLQPFLSLSAQRIGAVPHYSADGCTAGSESAVPEMADVSAGTPVAAVSAVSVMPFAVRSSDGSGAAAGAAAAVPADGLLRSMNDE